MGVTEQRKGHEPWRNAAADLDAGTPTLGEDELQRMLARTQTDMAEQDRGLRGWMRTRPTWLRRLWLLLVLAAPMAIVATLGVHEHKRALDTSLLVAAGAALCAAAFASALLATRPLHKPAIGGRRVHWVAFALSLGVMAAVALLGSPAFPPWGNLAHGAAECSLSGVLTGLPIVAAGLLIDRGSRLTPVLVIAAAASMANLLLLLRCADTRAAHALTGHVTVGLWLLGLALIARRWF